MVKDNREKHSIETWWLNENGLSSGNEREIIRILAGVNKKAQSDRESKKHEEIRHA